MNQTLLSFRNAASVKRHIGELKDVTFDIQSGEGIAFAGRTYSGVKEFSAVLSLRKEYTGDICLNDGRQLRECHSSYDSGILPIDQKVLQSVSSGTLLDSLVVVSGQKKIYSLVNEKETTGKFRRLLAELQLPFWEANLTRKVRSLSRKELIEYAILYSLYADASSILLENPFQGLKNDEIAETIVFLKKAKQRGVSILYISDEHFDQLEELIDRVVVFRHGRVNYIFYPQKGMRRFDPYMIELASGGKKENRKALISQKKGTFDLSLRITTKDRELSFSSGDRIGIYDPAMKIPIGYKELASFLDDNCEIEKNGNKLTFTSMDSFLNASIALITKDPERELFLNLSPVENVTMLSGRRNSSVMTSERIDRYIYRETAEKYSYLKRCLTIINENSCYTIPAILRKELAVAKWLSLDPDIIIFFDLEDSYQPAEQEQSAELIRQLSMEGKIVISVSSNLDFLEKTSETIIS